MQLLEALDANVWLWYKSVPHGKRVYNKVDTGILTTGEAPWPIQPYQGPRGGPSDNDKADMKPNEPEGPLGPSGSSLQKVHRGGGI